MEARAYGDEIESKFRPSGSTDGIAPGTDVNTFRKTGGISQTDNDGRLVTLNGMTYRVSDFSEEGREKVKRHAGGVTPRISAQDLPRRQSDEHPDQLTACKAPPRHAGDTCAGTAPAQQNSSPHQPTQRNSSRAARQRYSTTPPGRHGNARPRPAQRLRKSASAARGPGGARRSAFFTPFAPCKHFPIFAGNPQQSDKSEPSYIMSTISRRSSPSGSAAGRRIKPTRSRPIRRGPVLCWTCSPIRRAPACMWATRWATSPRTSTRATGARRGFNVRIRWATTPAFRPNSRHPDAASIRRSPSISPPPRTAGQIGFSFDWDREVCTAIRYYKWTQWAFSNVRPYYCNDRQQARPIEELTATFERNGSEGLNVACT